MPNVLETLCQLFLKQLLETGTITDFILEINKKTQKG